MAPVEVHREAPPVNPDEVEAETQKVLQQLEVCTVNQNWKSYPKKWWAKYYYQAPFRQVLNFWIRFSIFLTISKGIECSASKTDPSINAKKQDNRLYGLHALNNLDIAVNGKEVNSMPSYQEIRRNSFGSNSIISDQPSASNQHPTSGIPVLRPTLNGETPPKVKNLCYLSALKSSDCEFCFNICWYNNLYSVSFTQGLSNF